ncbi:MAG: hypothetical protein LQ350_007751 [Teloschistes chrysophthalmus]|nr:MAG: hypothetical protein LQ350_007751 [Niorma chrysophthalma]
MKGHLSHSWKFLTSKIHQPLPLDRRTTHRLLTALNTSFQRNLDRQYPQGLDGSEQSPDAHIDSLLKSPLFGMSRVQHSSSSPRKDGARTNNTQLREMEFALEEPVEYFKQQVSTGSATLDSAKVALSNQLQKALASAALDPKDSMKDSGIGSVMVNWLWSSGQYEELDFLGDQVFIHKLMPFLIVEGQYKPVWRWLQHLRNGLAQMDPAQTQRDPSLLKNISRLWYALTRGEVLYGQGLQSAMQMFMTSYRSMQLSEPAIPVDLLQRISVRAGQSLMWNLSYGKSSAALEDTVIEDFRRFTELWALDSRVNIFRALILISHPRQPDIAHALTFLAKIKSAKLLIRERDRPFVVRIGLKTVELLLAQGSFSEAASVMKTLQTDFASELGLNTEPPAQTEIRERSTLRASNLLFAV